MHSITQMRPKLPTRLREVNVIRTRRGAKACVYAQNTGSTPSTKARDTRFLSIYSKQDVDFRGTGTEAEHCFERLKRLRWTSRLIKCATVIDLYTENAKEHRQTTVNRNCACVSAYKQATIECHRADAVTRTALCPRIACDHLKLQRR